MEATAKAYKSIQAPRMPNLVCTGQITEVGDAHVSKSGQYVVTSVKITADGAGKNTAIHLCIRPEWNAKGFDPNEIEEVYGSSVDFVYRTHFDNRGKVAFLKGLLGSEENYVAFRNDSIVADAEQFDAERFSTMLRDRILNQQVGYVLRQDSEKVVDDEGNVEYIRTERYKVDRMFFPTKEELKRLRNQAERSNGNTLFTAEVPF